MPQRVRVVDQQDGVADDDAGQHDDADVGLQAEGGVRDHEAAHHADGRQRNREHDDERIAQRLVLRRHHGVDEHEGEDEQQLELLERLGLFLDLRAEPDGEVTRDVQLRQPRLHGLDRLAQRRFDLGVHALDALLVLALDLDGARLRPHLHQVLRLHHLAGRRR